MRKQLFFVAALALSTAGAWADDRAPEPTSVQIEEADKLVKEVYKDDFAKRGIDERRALAEKLLEEGNNNKSDPNSQYVLLRDARDAAVQVGDVATAMSAIQAMSQFFVVNPVELKMAALGAMRASLHTSDAQEAAAEACVTLLSEAMAADNFDVASKTADLALNFATGAKNMTMVSEIQARRTEIKTQSTAYLAMKIAEEKLKKDPKDAPSNYAMGIYLALYKNDWDKGLPLLAEGNDEAFAAVSKLDLASPVDVAAMTKVADDWFDLASSHPGMKVRVLARAEFWYNLISPNVDGLVKAKVDKRLEQIAAAKEGSVAVAPAISEATRKVLPTTSEMKQLKELAAGIRVNGNQQGQYIQMVNTLEGRMNTYFQQNFTQNNFPQTKTSTAASTLKDADFFALCKADADIHKVTAGTFFQGNSNLVQSFAPFAESAKTKDEFAAHLLAYEKFNNVEKAVDQMNADSIVYSTIRNFVTRNAAMFPTGPAKVAFCTFLTNKGIKSAGVERYRAYAARFR